MTVNSVTNQDLQTANCNLTKGIVSTKREPIGNIFGKENGFEESLTRGMKFHSLFNADNTMTGKINGKQVVLVKDTKMHGLFDREEMFEGTMGDKEVNVSVRGNTITGTINGKEVNIKIDPGMGLLKPFSITGTIGDKEINITKGSFSGAAQGENDIITLALSLSGKEAVVENGIIKGLQGSDQARADEQQMMCEEAIYNTYYC